MPRGISVVVFACLGIIVCVEGQCQDTLGWSNSFHRNCGVYDQLYCMNAMALPGSEYSLGSKYNYPEQHCCSCGKEVVLMAAAYKKATQRRRRRRRQHRRRAHLIRRRRTTSFKSDGGRRRRSATTKESNQTASPKYSGCMEA